MAIKTSPKKIFVRRADIDAYLIEMNRDMPIPVPPTPIEIIRQNRAAAIKAGREALRLQQEKEKNAVPRVIGKDGRSYPATKKQPEHKPRKIEVPERSPLIPESIAGPYSYEAIQWLESLQNAMLAKPLDLTLRIHEGQLIVQSTNTEKPTLGTVPLERGTDWENWSFKPFFKFNETELEALESAGIKTIGQLSKVISTKWDERISVPKFGAKKLADLEEKFDKFWKDHPELCQ